MIISTLLLATTMYLPRTNERTLSVSPLDEGEIAHMVVSDVSTVKEAHGRVSTNEENAATLWIGGEGGETLPVVDGSALRGFKVVTLDRNEYSTTYDNSIVYTHSNDTWSAATAENGVHRLVITCPSYITIREFNYNEQNETIADQSPVQIGSITSSVSNNIAVITFNKQNNRTEASRRYEVSDITIKYIAYGNTEHVTDLSDHIFQLRDSIGDWTLGDLRPWASHLYDGNRGADWSRYHATNRVWFSGETLTFDKRKRYSIVADDAATNITFVASGMPVWSIYSSGTGEGYEGCFTFTNFVRNANSLEFYFSQDIDGFDIAQLSVETNSVLATNGWVAIPSSAYHTKRDGYIKLNGSYSGTAFYRLNYAGNISTILRLNINAPTDFSSSLTVNGASVLTERLLAGYTADFNGGTDLALHCYEALTNIIIRLGGSVANPPSR